MKLPAIDFVRSDQIRQHARRFEGKYAGELTVEIPVGFDTGITSVTEGVFKVRLTVEDRMKRDARHRHVFPPFLPLPDDWPFSWRVEVVDADAGFFDLPSAAIARATGGTGSGVITSVTIRVFALPGVQVTVAATDDTGSFNLLDPLEQQSGSLKLKVQVERLCRPESLPVPGTPPVGATLYPGHPIAAIETGSPERRALGQFFVQHVENGVDFQWVATQQTLSIRYNRATDADTGIAYWLNPEPQLPRHGDFLDYDDLLHILLLGEGHDIHLTRPANPDPETLTGAARNVAEFGQGPKGRPFFIDPLAWGRFVELQQGGGVADQRQLPELWRRVEESRFFRLTELRSFDDLPPYGKPFSIEPQDDVAKARLPDWLKEKPGAFEAFAKFAIDLGIGFVPIAGDVVDFAEFNLALSTGKDRWGEDVENWELVLMGLSVIPVFGSAFPIVRRLARAL